MPTRLSSEDVRRMVTDTSVVGATRDGSGQFVRSCGNEISIRVINVAVRHKYVMFQGKDGTVWAVGVVVRYSLHMTGSILGVYPVSGFLVIEVLLFLGN